MKKTLTWTKENPWILVPILLIAYYLYSQLFNVLAERHFNAHCEQDAGEFIYKTVDDVEGVFQMRPRDHTKYYFDNLRHYKAGTDELIEDPFGHTDSEAQDPWVYFVRPDRDIRSSYQYLESSKPPVESIFAHFKIVPNSYSDSKYWKYSICEEVSEDGFIYCAEQTPSLQSLYGFTWQEIRGKWDTFFNIWGGELLVKDLKTDETLAIRRGYFSFKYGICPRDKESNITYKFVSKVLKPSNQAGLDTQGDQ